MRTVGYTSLATGKVKHIRIGGKRRSPLPATAKVRQRRRAHTIVQAERDAAIAVNPLKGLAYIERMQIYRIRKRLAAPAQSRRTEQHDGPLWSPLHNDLDVTIRK